MSNSPFKTFVKFKEVEQSYEDDCKIYYPTPWDREYLAYRRYCQDRVNEMVLSAYNANVVFDEEMLQYIADFPLYAMRSYFCPDEQDNEAFLEPYEHLPFVPFDSTDVIKIYDNTSVDIRSEHCECSDSQYEESDIDVIENDSNIRFNLNRVDYGTANYVEYEQYQSRCKHCKLHRRCRKAPSNLNLGVFLSNIETKPKVLKRRKVKQLRSRKFEHVSRNSCTSVTSIVNSDINIEEVITVEDCDCNKIPTTDNRMFKMTYRKAVHCKSSKFKLIGKTTSGKVDNQVDVKNTKHQIRYSQVVSGNFSQYSLTTSSTSGKAGDKKSTPNTFNAETDFETVHQVAAKNNTMYKTYSQALYGKPKSGYPRLSKAPTCDEIQNDNSHKMSKEKSKTYSQVLYCNLPKSRIITQKKSQKIVNLRTTQIDKQIDIDQTVTKDIKSCKTYSEVVHSNLPKSKLRKPPSSNKKVGLSKTVIENAFDQVITEEVKTYKTSYSHAVYHNLPKSSSSTEKSKEQRSTDVKTCGTYTKVVYCTVSKSRLIKKTSSNKEVGFNASPKSNDCDQLPSDEVNTKKTFSQAVSCGAPKLGNDFDQIPMESINETTTKNIKSSKTEMNKAELNKISTNDISEAVDNILPATSLIDQKTSENKINSDIPTSQLWSKIVSGVSEKPITPEVDSHKSNTVTFSKDTVEIEIDPRFPISSTFQIVSGEIHAITSVQDDTKDIPEIEKPTTVPTCQTWSRIVTGENVSTASLVCDKIGESKCNQDVPEEKILPTCSKMDSEAILGTSLDCIKTKMFKKESNPEIKPLRVTNEVKLKKKKKSRFVKLDMSTLEDTLEKPAELKQVAQSMFSYADIMKTRKTDASCVNSAPVQTDILLTPPKYRSHMDSSPSPTPQSTHHSNSFKKDEWILQKPKHKRSKRSNKM